MDSQFDCAVPPLIVLAARSILEPYDRFQPHRLAFNRNIGGSAFFNFPPPVSQAVFDVVKQRGQLLPLLKLYAGRDAPALTFCMLDDIELCSRFVASLLVVQKDNLVALGLNLADVCCLNLEGRVDTFPNLKALKIVESREKPSLEVLGPLCPNLEALAVHCDLQNITLCTSLLRYFTANLREHFSRLTYFELSGVVLPLQRSVGDLCAGLPLTLEALSFGGIPRLDLLAAHDLSRFGHLRALDLAGTADKPVVFNQPESIFDAIFVHMKRIQHVDLSFTNLLTVTPSDTFEVSKSGIPQFRQMQRKLKFLGLFWCSYPLDLEIPAETVASASCVKDLIVAATQYRYRLACFKAVLMELDRAAPLKPAVPEVVAIVARTMRDRIADRDFLAILLKMFAPFAKTKIERSDCLVSILKVLIARYAFDLDTPVTVLPPSFEPPQQLPVSRSTKDAELIKTHSMRHNFLNHGACKLYPPSRQSVKKPIPVALVVTATELLLAQEFVESDVEDLMFYAVVFLQIVTLPKLPLGYLAVVFAHLHNATSCITPEEQTLLVCSKTKGFQKLFRVVKERMKRNPESDESDRILEDCFSVMWNLTDENPGNCEIFVKSCGIELCHDVLRRYALEPELIANVTGLLGNVAEVPSLRPLLATDPFLGFLTENLQKFPPTIPVGYNCACILCNLLSQTELWSQQRFTACPRTDVVAMLHAAVKSWRVKSQYYMKFRTLTPVIRLMESLDTNSWPLFVVANLTSLNLDKNYSQLFVEEGGVAVVELLLANEALQPYLKSLCKVIMKNVGIYLASKSEPRPPTATVEDGTVWVVL